MIAKYPYFVIKLLNPRDLATVGYWCRDRYIPVLHNYHATRFDSAEDARGIALNQIMDHAWGQFMRGWKVQPAIQIVKVTL